MQSVDSMPSLCQIEKNYTQFIQQPTIQAFLASGGRVFIASEKLPLHIIQKWIELGHRHFAEKYVQEVQQKWKPLRSDIPDLVLHQYGHLQSNKLNMALDLFDGLESIDSCRLIEKIASCRTPTHRLQNLWVQVNLGEEPQKSGLPPHQVEEFIHTCRRLNLTIRGLMAIPPKADPASIHFKRLRELADQCQLEECIMGMSQDYPLAIEMGSSVIRVKRALLGSL